MEGLALIASGILAVSGALSVSFDLTGTFALLGGSPHVTSQLHAAGSDTPGDFTLKFRQFHDGKPILNYRAAEERFMHLIVVRDDFATFAHEHPAFDATSGTFIQPLELDPAHWYYVYADTTPQGLHQQVFRFTLQSGDPAVTPAPASLLPSVPRAKAGPYTVLLAKTSLPAGRAAMLTITIKNGKEIASDLSTYLGMAAHCVFIDTATLQYAHVHAMMPGMAMDNDEGATPMAMPEQKIGPLLTLQLPALPAGIYKLWIQFRGAHNNVYTAPFTLAVR